MKAAKAEESYHQYVNNAMWRNREEEEKMKMASAKAEEEAAENGKQWLKIFGNEENGERRRNEEEERRSEINGNETAKRMKASES